MAAVRLSRLQRQILRWLAADEQRTRGLITSSHPELVAALPSAKGNISHSLRRLETQGLIVMLRTPGGKTESVSLTAAGRQQRAHLAGSYASGGPRESHHRLATGPWCPELGRGPCEGLNASSGSRLGPVHRARMCVARARTRPSSPAKQRRAGRVPRWSRLSPAA